MKLCDATRKQLPGYCASVGLMQGGEMPEGFMGIKFGDRLRQAMDAGTDYVYFDHSYFKRGWNNGYFRAVRNALHLTHMLDRPDDRMRKFGVEIEPWRKKGREIVIIPPSEYQVRFHGCDDWLMHMETRLDQVTDRPVICKRGKMNSMREFCADAWAVVTYSSVAGVEAALMGIPVFSTELCPSWPVNAGSIESIDRPEYVDFREKWAASLAYSSWHAKEIERIRWHDYNYEAL